MSTVEATATDPKATTPAVVDEKASDPAPTAKAPQPSGPRKTPFEHISTSPDVKIPGPTTLSADEEAKYNTLLEEVLKWSEIPDSTKTKTKSPLTDEERLFLTKDCLLRYLRASKWKLPDASKRLLSTLTWRREYGTSTISADHVSIEGETGKQFILGWDINGRTCLYMNPAKQNTDASPRQVQQLVWMLERVIELSPPAQESICLVINFGMSSKHPSIATGKEVLNILQNHYPERLGRALVNNLPWAVWGFFKLITPFIDPVTREKLKFNEKLRQWVPADQLPKSHGGDSDFEYDHSVYWPAIQELSAARKKVYVERWEKGGKRIGEREAYLKGGEGELSISQIEENAKPKEDPAAVEKVPEKAVEPTAETTTEKPAESAVVDTNKKEEAAPVEAETKKEETAPAVESLKISE